MIPQLCDFEGLWSLSRKIFPAGEPPAEFSGTARFTRQGQSLGYCEEGQLKLAHVPAFRAERRYIWHAEGGRIYVSYDDGRPFHDFDPADPAAQHLCDPDLYRVRYDFSVWPEWRSLWQVKGPRKNYRLENIFSRLPGTDD